MYQLVPHDDIVFVPELRSRHVGVGIDKRHRFKRKGVPEKLRVKLLDVDGRPRQGTTYTLQINATKHKGVIGIDGVISHFIPPHSETAKLTLNQDGRTESYLLLLGQLRPPSTILGLQQRLRNLGLLTNELSGTMDNATRDALLEFQRIRGLQKSGVVEATSISEFEKDFWTR